MNFLQALLKVNKKPKISVRLYNRRRINLNSQILFLGVMFWVCGGGKAIAEPFSSCPAPAYLSQGSSNSTIKLYTVDLFSGGLNAISASDIPGGINGIGFNQLDGYIYGMKSGINNIVTRLDNTGVATDLGSITGLPTANYNVGDVDSNGVLHVSAGGGTIYGIDITPSSPNYLKVIKTITSVVSGIQDFAFHPTNGKLYTIQQSGGKIYEISWSSGANVTATNNDRGTPTALLTGSAYGGVFFAIDGSFYGYRNGTNGNTDGRIYRITNISGTGLPIATLITSSARGVSQNDGARCALAPPIYPPNTVDYGDAPDTGDGTGTGNYRTKALDNGPGHEIIAGLRIGTNVDGDSGSLQNTTATDDDGNGSPNDEDGVASFPTLYTDAGASYSVSVKVTNTTGSAYLVGYIDFNKDGDFDDANEKSTIVNVPNNPTGNQTVVFTTPAGMRAGNTYARFRLSNTSVQAESSVGIATSGEVEDYQVAITGYDYGDAPAGYENNNSARHVIVSSLRLGDVAPDDESAAQSSANADGDDAVAAPNLDDEDGISTFPSLSTNNTSYSLTAKVNNTSGNAANVYGWLDFDHDGKFDGDERATVSNDTITLDSNSKVPTGSNGTVTLTWNNLGSTGANIIDGNSYARIRLTTDNLSAASATTTRDSASVGNATNGEVEDYPIAIAPNTPLPPNDTSFKFCPAPTTETNYSDYRIAWTYNVPNNTLLPDHQPWPNKQYDATQIARASAQVIGSGMTYSFDADKQTVIRLSGVNQSDATSAYANGDYIEYQLTTNNTMDLERLFNGIAFAKHNYIQNYKIGIIFSKDNFATASTLLSDYTVQASAGGYEWTPIVTNQPIHLEPNTTYKFRILFYGATNPSTVYWDDLHLSMGGCQDFSDAPTTNYGAASHGLPPMVTYYLGTNKPDAESGVRDGGDGGVNADGDDTGGNTPDDEDGLVIPTLQQGKLTTVDVKVNGANGYLQAWFDWDGDSNFTPLGEQIATNVQDGSTSDLDGLVNGTIQLAINVPANATTTQTYARFRWSSSQNVNLIDRTGDGEVEDYQIAIAQASNPNLLLVKRITAINPGQPSAIQFDNFIDDIDTLNDNNSKWPDSNSNHNDNINAYLRGVSNYSAVKPGDEVEYTIYFLSNGDVNAKEVKICDAVPDHMTFVKNTYGVELGIGLGFDSTALPISLNLKLSNLLNDDQGDFYGAGTAPPIDLCKKVTPANTLINVNGTNNTNGAVVVELGNLPKANSPGSPTDSYGFIRFRGKVK